MRKIVFLLAAMVAVAFSSQIAAASHPGGNETNIDFTNIKQYEIPGVVGKIIGDARANIYDYELHGLGSITILNGTVSETSGGLLENPTHNVFVKDAGTLQGIFDAQSFVKEFNRQRSLHNIRFEALSFFDQVKLTIGTWIVAMMSAFIGPE